MALTQARTQDPPSPATAGYLAGYLRISEDKNGIAEGVEQQERWFRAFGAEHFPGTPIRVFRDNSLTAAKRDVNRPGFEALREAIAAGEVAAIWTVEQSRLMRDRIGWFPFAYGELLPAGLDVIHTYAGQVALDSWEADIVAIKDAREAQTVSERTRRDQDDLAAEGRPAGGSTSFGFDRVRRDRQARLEINETEAEELKQAADRVLRQGWNPTQVGRDLMARGIPTKNGPRCHGCRHYGVWIDGERVCDFPRCPERGTVIGPGTWSHTQVVHMLTNATVAGKRRHRGEITDVGVTWEAILPEADWLALRAKLAPKERQVRPSRYKYLLSGCLRCVCGNWMVGQSGAGQPSYRCSCGSGIKAEAVEEYVTGELLARLDVLTDRLGLGDDTGARRDEITAELAGINDQRSLYGRLLADKDMDLLTYKSARETLTEREEALSRELAALPPLDSGVIDPDAVRAGWAHLEMAEQRELIARFSSDRGDPIVIDRHKGGKRAFDLGRIHLPKSWS